MTLARRVTMHQARRMFEAGRTVLVSENGHRETIPVGPSTTCHTRETVTWDELTRQVREWRGRYPRQRFYVVDAASAPDLYAASPFDPAGLDVPLMSLRTFEL